MELYRRDIFWKLLLFRTAFILLLSLSGILFFTAHRDYTLLTFIALVTLSCFSIKGLILFEERFEIREYFVSGIIPLIYRYTLKHAIDIETTLIHNDGPSVLLVEPSWSQPDFSYKSYMIEILDKGAVKRKHVMNLSDKEYELMFNFYLKQTRKDS